MKQEKLISMLDDCLLSDAELLQGEEMWKQFEDPFVPWTIQQHVD